jgi:hypothetical protein
VDLILPNDCLTVFVDDTGHEALVKGHPVYGLGGCAIVAADLDRVIRNPWREVRRKVTGSPDTPLHASSFGQKASQDQIRSVSEFFGANPFSRFGAIVSTTTTFADEMDAVSTIAGVLKNRIIDIAKWWAFRELKVIFESSERADRLIEGAFENFQLQENGRPIPVECYFMPKRAGDAAIEVADFVMHAVGRQARRKLQGRDGFAPDFAAVFHTVDRKLISFIEVDKVERNTQ